MSISNALSNAYSGLSAVSRAAETISNNVSNALTDGYSRQEVVYSATAIAGQGAGVQIDAIVRVTDSAGTAARQRVGAELANVSTTSDAVDRLAAALGEPGDLDALAVRLSNFEGSLANAVSAPDSTALQNGILADALAIVVSFSQISTETIRIRVDADTNIAQQVKTVNSSLKQIEDLSAEIRILSNSGRSVATLEDQRQMLIGKVNEIIPVKISQTQNGGIALFTLGGAILLNDTARELGFTPTVMMTPDMTLSSGALSGITINGKPLTIGQSGGPLEGGALAANFYIRDTIAPRFQQQIDALARDLVERFQDPAVDPSLTIGAAGLFTDSGLKFDQINEIGLAGRISINALVDPASGGQLWRIRDGLGAVIPGFSGNPTQLMRMQTALTGGRPASSGMGVALALGSAGFAEEVTSFWSLESSQFDEHQAQKQALFDTLQTAELNETGVDTDREMQDLLSVEQAYSANARVISVIDGLMKTLLEM